MTFSHLARAESTDFTEVVNRLGAAHLDNGDQVLKWLLTRLGITKGFKGYRNVFESLSEVGSIAADLDLPGVDWVLVRRAVDCVMGSLGANPSLYPRLAASHHPNPLFTHFAKWPLPAALLEPIRTERKTEVLRVQAILLSAALASDNGSDADPVRRAATEVRKACSYETQPEDIWANIPFDSTGTRYLWHVYNFCGQLIDSEATLGGWRSFLLSVRDLSAYLAAESLSKSVEVKHHLLPDEPEHLRALTAEDRLPLDVYEPGLTYLLEETPPTSVDATVYDAGFKATARLSRHWLETFTSGIPWSTHALNPIELAFFRNRLREDRERDVDAVVLLLGLIIATSSTIEEVLALKLGVNGDITDQGFFRKRVSRPGGLLSSRNTDESLFEPSAETLDLMLPDVIKQNLAKLHLLKPGSDNLSELLGASADSYRERVGRYLATIREAGYRRVTIDRVRLILRNQLSRFCDDPVVIHLLTSSSADAFPSASYYTSLPVPYLLDLYGNATKAVFGD